MKINLYRSRRPTIVSYLFTVFFISLLKKRELYQDYVLVTDSVKTTREREREEQMLTHIQSSI